VIIFLNVFGELQDVGAGEPRLCAASELDVLLFARPSHHFWRKFG
jgi:hypothetical protein